MIIVVIAARAPVEIPAIAMIARTIVAIPAAPSVQRPKGSASAIPLPSTYTAISFLHWFAVVGIVHHYDDDTADAPQRSTRSNPQWRPPAPEKHQADRLVPIDSRGVNLAWFRSAKDSPSIANRRRRRRAFE